MSTKILQGDCRDILPTLPSGSVHCVVTSPPYYGLRDYGTAQWEGGDAACDHERPKAEPQAHVGSDGRLGTNNTNWDHRNEPAQFRAVCGKCGARRIDAQIGLEPTPDEYIATMVAVFREVRRVLRDDGTVFCNMGDGYSDKQLLLMPARLALALQADGWWIRSDIIWSKPNPMPESVQGSHISRHMITIPEYERLSGMPYSGQRRWSVRTSDLPSVPTGEVSARQASVSAKRQGSGNGTAIRGNAGTAGETPPILAFLARAGQPEEVSGEPKGQGRWHQEIAEAPGEAGDQSQGGSETSANEGQCNPESATPISQLSLQGNGQGQSAEPSPAGQAQGRDPSNRGAINSSAVDCDREDSEGSLLLLWGEGQANAGSRDTAEQGRPAYSDERRSRLSAVQLEEERPADPAGLVECPGCSRCNNGYIVHLSAGRPTSAHEHIFLLSKRASYFYDADAVREESIKGNAGSFFNAGKTAIHQLGRSSDAEREDAPGRNLRNVWSIATHAYPEAHFATFPPELAERCIRAGTSEKGACPQCGAPWYRVVDKFYHSPRGNSVIGAAKGLDSSNNWSGYPVLNAEVKTIGWHPTCGCDKCGPVVPCTVLDPFAGAGTTLLVADRLQRDGIAIELSPAYCAMLRARIVADAPLLAEVAD